MPSNSADSRGRSSSFRAQMMRATADIPSDIHASNLGLPPGVWPNTIDFNGIELRRHQPFTDCFGQLVAFTYFRPDGRLIRVLSY